MCAPSAHNGRKIAGLLGRLFIIGRLLRPSPSSSYPLRPFGRCLLPPSRRLALRTRRLEERTRNDGVVTRDREEGRQNRRGMKVSTHFDSRLLHTVEPKNEQTHHKVAEWWKRTSI